MKLLALFGTGPYRLLYMAIAIIGSLGIIFGAYKMFTNHYVHIGEHKITNQINAQNNALDNKVISVNQNVTTGVSKEQATNANRSSEVQNAINNSASEPLSNVSRNRLDVVRHQQSVRKTGKNTR
jgi:hypothetical protein